MNKFFYNQVVFSSFRNGMFPPVTLWKCVPSVGVSKPALRARILGDMSKRSKAIATCQKSFKRSRIKPLRPLTLNKVGQLLFVPSFTKLGLNGGTSARKHEHTLKKPKQNNIRKKCAG